MPVAGLPAYSFSDAATGGSQHGTLLEHLAEVYDPDTLRRLRELRLSADATVLEVGAGGSRVAPALAGQLPEGEVTVTDLDISHVTYHARLRALKHDIVSEPLPGEDYHVIYARAVLVHLPARAFVLRKLIAGLRPGGVLMIQEFAPDGWRRCVLDAPDVPEAQRLFDAYYKALRVTMDRGGSDRDWGRSALRAMRAAGLVDVEARLGSARSWQGGQAGCLLPLTMTYQLGSKLIAGGMHPADIGRFRALLLDPRLVILNSPMDSTMGRKP